ncbi:hypothetical protein [Corallococcus terminator]|uniref:Pilus assembly protein n=1 Tax=Corallococcus terminator TaxID=2316733 RepID=A0A3A8J3Q4_9BACT|nr:hypothetical protein [Corallococcus terminator]RKG86540.1 hypothetical protein D7V88_17630 [Corallococcus terminator]
MPEISRRRRSRGQSMVLACLSFLVLALMVTLSFNLTHALRNKMGLQQHSDTMAYSMAVMEARALNYYAVSNRSIAASYVAMASMHAYMSTASLTREMLKASQTNFYIIMAMEFAQCACWTCIKHCIHGIQALKVANKYSKKANSYASDIKDVEDSFNQTIKALDTIVETVHASQMAAHAKTALAVQNGSASGLSEMTEWSSKGASTVAGGVGGLNANEFNCAVDGLPCMGGGSNSAAIAHSKTMTDIANASRPGWTANRDAGGIPAPYYLHPSFLNELMNDIPGEGLHLPLPTMKGSAGVGAKKGDWAPPGQVGTKGSTVVSRDEGGAMFNQWKDGIAPYMPFDAEIWSDSNGGGHNPKQAHSGRHEFDGIATNTGLGCVMTGNCFMKFRGNSQADKDFGQPRSYSYVTRSLRSGNASQAPWELNSSATLNFTHGEQGTAKLTLAADEGAALSKALVYYHRLGANGWREAPNLFNPFWRAKLHPFTAQEAATVLGAAGSADSAQLAATPELSL